MIARIAGVAIDARMATLSTCPRERALAARWIASNLLAARGVRMGTRGAAPDVPRVFGVHTKTLTGAIAAVAAVPSLLDPATLPRRWYMALLALGVPLADRPLRLLIEGGASVAQLEPVWIPSAITVDEDVCVDITSDRLFVA